MVATDGVFSMDGIVADLRRVCDLAERYGAITMVDDSHAVGFMGAKGRGTHEHCEVMGRVDILTGTLGKALGGASGGYTSGKREVVEWLRNRSRPYLFSNSLAPVIAGGSIRVLDKLERDDSLRRRLHDNARYFRGRMEALGFTCAGADHPIIPVMLGDAKLAKQFADEMMKEGVYVIGFSFPVVPKGQARIRTQMSARLTRDQLERAVGAFERVGKRLGVIS
jgi:glycine C-acetyltransferase